MGFDVSFQKVGINRVAEYLKTARTKGPVVLDGKNGGRGDGEKQKRNEPWRRISDLVGRMRRRGIPLCGSGV